MGGLAKHWNYYRDTASSTVNSVKQAGGQSVHPIEPGTRDRLPQSSETKDGRATDSCFALVGAHQCGILMDVLGQLAVYVSTTSASTCGYNKSRQRGYSLRIGAWLKGSLCSITLGGDTCWEKEVGYNLL